MLLRYSIECQLVPFLQEWVHQPGAQAHVGELSTLRGMKKEEEVSLLQPCHQWLVLITVLIQPPIVVTAQGLCFLGGQESICQLHHPSSSLYSVAMKMQEHQPLVVISTLVSYSI